MIKKISRACYCLLLLFGFICLTSLPILSKQSASCSDGYFGVCRKLVIEVPGQGMNPCTGRPEATCVPVNDPNEKCSFGRYAFYQIAFTLGDSAMN